MADRPDDRLLDHDYDGIREYDNPMPRWWLWIFYATILFVPLYYLLPSPFGEGEGVVAQYEADVAAHAAAAPAPPTGAMDDAAISALAQRADVVAAGKAVFEANCAVCHRLDGGGLIGPNLTDDAWLHGGAPAAVRTTIAQGVLAKGMPAWDRILRPEQMDAVTAYVIVLHGTNPPSPKAPEGVVEPAKP
jgi:cytochrome c oxidase cbb3-type subunit 3